MSLHSNKSPSNTEAGSNVAAVNTNGNTSAAQSSASSKRKRNEVIKAIGPGKSSKLPVWGENLHYTGTGEQV